mmetsp:Transcript_26203/g.26446  ORF Transcript_26203/g.26446 Transcript_26203/m.26446 type:complete len:293 (-) Transcript_26203:190-1068(-)|eukprot:CAMPEP_0182430874 /NCGR_PEP_ID=MMETSP1167-20130531/44492_1 /TAXON_ID=2988 /ORGANISM="Mallomonas Sp, Strain CCMP3275" /LENGTH=292 /DNA_ID=CAMNT_0024616505 /DNA_START=73 /DNA_END=951 /DNA_ORIENTATION=+
MSDSEDDVLVSELIKKESETPQHADKEDKAEQQLPPKNENEVAVKEEKSSNDVKNDVAEKIIEDDDDSDDNIPIAELLKRKTKQKAEETVAATEQRKSMNGATTKRTISINNKKLQEKKLSNASTTKKDINKINSNDNLKKRKLENDPSSSTSCSIYSDYYETRKGFLVQTLLRRWWYVIQWPRESDQFTPPPGYEGLDGFRGVFVCTNTANLGHILDMRDHKTCPCLVNFANKPAEELKTLCVQAIKEQLRQLIDSEGSGSKLERQLKDELKEVEAVKTDKADKFAAKIKL